MLMQRAIAASVLAAVCGAGCDSAPATPFSPSLVGPAGLSGAAPASPLWRLKTTLTSVAGPPTCFDFRGAVGRSIDAVLDVRLEGEAITLTYDLGSYPNHHFELVGELHGDRFEASTSWHGHQPCGGRRVDYEFESQVTGQLSDDGRSIVASERWTYRFDQEGDIVLWFAWEAERASPRGAGQDNAAPSGAELHPTCSTV
jgi:hypothetical protein